MKSIYILAVVILVFSASVLTADDDAEVPRNDEQDLELRAIDLIWDSELLLDVEDGIRAHGQTLWPGWGQNGGVCLRGVERRYRRVQDMG